MPTLNLQHSLLEYIQELNGSGHSPESWSDWLPAMGCPVEGNDEDVVEVEVFPDRPDLLSHESLARAARNFADGQIVDASMEIESSGVEMFVEASLGNVRPVVLAAVVRGVDTGDDEEGIEAFIQSLMDHQEKLHLTLGRKRLLASIGVHDLSSVKGPFRVLTVPETYSFVPLMMNQSMSIEQILKEHPKGMEYAHLMEELDSYPVILDANDDILSFPPIINGDHTTVSHSTKDFLIDVTGWDIRACEACLMLVCLSLYERGGKVESVKVTSYSGEEMHTPRGDPVKHRVPESLISKILGLELSQDEIGAALNRMGGLLLESRTVTDGSNKQDKWADCVIGEKEHIVEMPRWRSDIMHPIDIVEDIAIGFGYQNLPEKLSEVHLDAIPLPSSHLHRRIRSSLRSLGIQETQGLTLSNEKDQFNKVGWEPIGGVAMISNPISVEHTILRQSILPSLLVLLSSNRHHELPQKVYELSDVVRESANRPRVAWACAEVGGGFAAAKGVAQALLRDLGVGFDEISLEEIVSGPWIAGRGARIMFEGVEIGSFGEISPKVLHEFGLRSPVNAGEFDVEALNRLAPDPIL
ncbi:MAG: phenylalanine--tRNA ligase subunit beta [Candidatus Thermoplasmatota archaeon]|nr:phenylalanine--tRNA ligase subunit beta [Candidatus Thermoplasmatota archaeon]